MLIKAGIQVVSVLFSQAGLLSWFNAQLQVQWDRGGGKTYQELHKLATKNICGTYASSAQT